MTDKITKIDEERARIRLENELKYGGYREDEYRNRYWLTSKQLHEFEQKNTEIKEDKDFWKWFSEFRTKEKIWMASWSSTTARRGEVIWKDDEKDEKKKDKYLSSWWTGYDYTKGKAVWESAYASTLDPTTLKLARAMPAIRTVIRVIDDSDPPMTVHWAQKGMSYTDFKNGQIHINPKPVQKCANEADGIDISTAFGMHEASHATYTKPIWDQILEPTPIYPVTISSLMANLVEDIRIERLTSEKFPGFAEYFAKGLAWMWKDGGGGKKSPTAYGPDLQDKINFAIAAVKWPDEAEKLWGTVEREELDWWRGWCKRYLADASLPLRATIQEAIDHLRIPTEKEKAEGKTEQGKAGDQLDEITRREKEAEARGEALKEMLRKFEKFLKDNGLDLTDFCPSPNSEDGLTSSESDRAERMASEELREDEIPVKMPNGYFKPRVYVSKPMEDERSKSSYIGKPSPHIAKLKAALLFRQELPLYTNRLQREGNLDEEELWRWKLNDPRLFEEKVIAVHPKVQMSLLVDMSGSMLGPNLRKAQELAQLFVWALRDMQNVTTKVFGHTANVFDSNDCQVYRLWEPGDPMTRLGLINTLPHHNNYDGFAIGSVVQEIMTRGDESEQRVVIVLADGYPAGSGYGGTEAFKHIKSVDDWARKHGVEVIQIAIDSDLDAARQSAMFKRWIPYTDAASLPRKLEALLAKLT